MVVVVVIVMVSMTMVKPRLNSHYSIVALASVWRLRDNSRGRNHCGIEQHEQSKGDKDIRPHVFCYKGIIECR